MMSSRNIFLNKTKGKSKIVTPNLIFFKIILSSFFENKKKSQHQQQNSFVINLFHKVLESKKSLESHSSFLCSSDEAQWICSGQHSHNDFQHLGQICKWNTHWVFAGSCGPPHRRRTGPPWQGDWQSWSVTPQWGSGTGKEEINHWQHEKLSGAGCSFLTELESSTGISALACVMSVSIWSSVESRI